MRKSLRKEPPIFKQGRIFNIDVNGHRVCGHQWNSGGSKKALVLHGFESSSKNFDRYISLLIKKNYEVIAVDAPAHGRSSGKRITLPLYLATIEKVNTGYGPFDAYIGHSFGALTLAHFLETTKHDHLTKAVLIAPATETTSTINTFFSVLHLDQEVRKEFDKLIYQLSGKWPSHYSVLRAMRNISAQVLWYHDEEDQLTPFSDAVKVKEEGYPNLVFRATKGLGHRRIYRDNEVIKDVLRFIESEVVV